MRKLLACLFVAALALTGAAGCKSTSAGCSTCGQ
jgi:hypothetical protein